MRKSADYGLNIFSKSLPEDQALVDVENLSPEEQDQLIAEFARKYRVTEDEATEYLGHIQQTTGKLPSMASIQAKDTGWDKPKRSSQIFSFLDNAAYNNLGGNDWIGNKLPFTRYIAPSQWGVHAVGAATRPVNYVSNKLIDAVAGKHKDHELVGLTKNVAVPVGTWSAGMKWGVPAAKKLGMLVAPKATAAVGGALGAAAKVLGPVGLAVDVGGTAVNTYKGVKDDLSGATTAKYTDETIQALGKGATPWQAARYYQMARGRDRIIDGTKLAAAAVGAVLSRGTTGGLLTSFGGARLHPEMLVGGPLTPTILLPRPGWRHVKRQLSALFGKDKESAVNRRIQKYRNRAGVWQGLLKDYAGAYFDHENDHVMNQIKRERAAFAQRAGDYIKQYNPVMADRIKNAAEGVHKAYLLKERDKWLKKNKGADKISYYDKAAQDVGADKSTL